MALVPFLFIAGLVFINGFFVAAEFALVKVRTAQIDQLAEEGLWAAKVTQKVLNHLDVYLSASQLGITVASLALGQAIESTIQPAVHQLLQAWKLPEMRWVVSGVTITLVPIIALSFVTFLHMALGEQAPKSLAIRSAKSIALWTAPVLVAFCWIFWPLIWALNSSSNLTLKLLGLGQTDHSELAHTEEELRHIVAESVAGGHLSRNERVMIENVLNLEEKTARRVMVPRPDIVYLSLARPLEDNLRVARQAGHTRFPLCEDDLTHVIGMIHVKDLFRASGSNGGRPDLRKLAREVPFLPETLHLDDLLIEFQRNRVHLAMLLDEYGGVVGMISLENVLEELVGPIQDEFDRETPQVIALGDGSYDVEAACPLDVMADAVGLMLPETDAQTAGGLVLELLGRMGRLGDTVSLGDRQLVITQADPTRIRRLRVEPKQTAGSTTPGT
jgi:CBS domain containing-hemolysin-like protein